MRTSANNDNHTPVAIKSTRNRSLRGSAFTAACLLSALTAGAAVDCVAKDKASGMLEAQPTDPVLACDVAMIQDAINPEFTFDNSGFNDGSQPMTVEIQLDSAQSLSTAGPVNNPYCRIDGRVVTPGEDVKDVSFQVSMPTLNFNGRYFGAGQGGFPGTGTVSNPPEDKLNEGWASASNDRGQQGVYITGLCPGTCGFHIGTIAAQRVTKAFYNSSSLVRYAAGCSGGGADGRGNMQAWGAEDFDGILSGASPASIGLVIGYVRIDKYLQAHPEGAISNDLLAQAEEAILARYDDADGALDGIVQDDRNFRLDDQVLRDVGFTDAQIATVHFINSTWHYDSPAISADGSYGGYPISRLSNWSARLGPFGAFSARVILQQIDPTLDYNTMTFDEIAEVLTTDVPGDPHDLTRFGNGGGKAIVYNGYHDQHVTAFDTIQTYEELARYEHHNRSDDYFRAFLVQGMDHCGGPKGPADTADQFFDALIAWVEEGKAPDSVVASRPGRTFLLCPEPYASVYDGKGDTNDAANWSCVKKPRKSRCGNSGWSPFRNCPAQDPDRGVSLTVSH